MQRFRLFYCLLAVAMMAGGASVMALDSPALSLARQLNEAFIEVADKVSPAVVVIEVTEKVRDGEADGSWWDLLPPEDQPRHHRHRHGSRPEKAEGEGSGVVISEDGYILTNDHVVENADKIVVRFKDGRAYEGEIRGSDRESDIAVVKIKARGLTTATLGDSDATRVGEFVLAIGAPFALSYSVTVGHVSAKGRSFEGETRGYADQDFIQTDASINPGNSGGPLVNLYGEVIAINTMIEGMNTGIGFAVPINLAKRVKDHLIAEGKFTRSWIGIYIEELREYPEYKDLGKPLCPDTEDGVVVVGMTANGPAAKSDLRSGDVIVSVEGKTVKTARELKDSILLQPPGHVLALNVVRGRDHLAIKVRTEALPMDAGLEEARQQPDAETASPAFGLTVQAITKDLAEEYGVAPNSGVVVTAVEGDSPADEKGIQPGDIITQINRQPVDSLKRFRQALQAADAKKGLMVNLISNGSTRMVILKDSKR
ncbi:MAG: trypsin-like peptidase domain-containing protein [Verrucomicrobiota bacterium]|jgi:serine protease Do